ncbi:MAG TPA: hypothetical protein DCY40_08730 [Actinobacteria bacterium]|nr:hypothetical protein [Actinomycetota bacterium]
MKRNALEREGDILFLLGLLQARPRTSQSEAARVLNERREATARTMALAAGKSEEEAAAAGREAQLSTQMVNRDINLALDRIREAGDGIGAVFLDDQISACQDDIDATYERDEQVMTDLERSRTPSTTKTAGSAAPITTRQDRAADAAFYMILIRNQELRLKLREEMRVLRFGRRMANDSTGAATTTLAEAWAGLADASPEQARKLALKLYAQEAANLARAADLEYGPLPAELQRAEALRAEKIARRLDGLRHFIPLAEPERDRRSYELVVTFGEDGPEGAPS